MLMWCARTCLLGRRAHVPTWSPVCAAHKHCGTYLQCARILGQPMFMSKGYWRRIMQALLGPMPTCACVVGQFRLCSTKEIQIQLPSQPAIHPQQVKTPTLDDPSLVCLPTTSCAQRLPEYHNHPHCCQCDNDDLDYDSNSGHAMPSLLGTVDWVVMVLYRSANHHVVS